MLLVNYNIIDLYLESKIYYRYCSINFLSNVFHLFPFDFHLRLQTFWLSALKPKQIFLYLRYISRYLRIYKVSESQSLSTVH